MDNGWIKIYRGLTVWRWYTEPNTIRLYLHLLLKATTKETPYRDFTLMPGQYAASLSQLGNELKMSARELRTAINNLVTTNELTIKTTNKFTLFSIQNWGKYQFCDKQNDKQTDKQKTNDIEQEYNNINTPTPGVRVREGLTPKENELFEKFLEMWSWQHGKGKRMSPYAEEGQLLNLLRLPEDTRIEALTRAITESWKNIHDIRRDARGRFIKEEKSFDVNDPSTWE